MTMRAQAMRTISGPAEASLGRKLGQVTWGLVALLTVTACVGFLMLYSAALSRGRPW